MKATSLQNSKGQKKILPFVLLQRTTLLLPKPRNNFMSKWHLIQPLQREIYQTPTLIVLSEAKLFRQVSCSTEFVRIMCLVCQHFDFNSADWFSDNLHASSCWFCKQWERNLATQFSRCSWGRMVCYTAVFSVVTLRSSSFVGRSVA